MADALMFSLFCFLFIGPVFFAIISGSVLHQFFGARLLPSVGLFVVAYLAFGGFYMLTLHHDPVGGFSSFGVDPDLSQARTVLAGLTLFWSFMFITAAAMAAFVLLPRADRSWRRVLKASVASGGASLLILFAAFLPVTDVSIFGPAETDSWAGLLPGKKFDLYFIDAGKVWKTDLTSGHFEEGLAVPEESGELYINPAGKGAGEIVIGNLSVQDVPVGKIKTHSSLIFDDRVEQQRLIGYRPGGDYYVGPALVLSTPFLHWNAGRDDVFPASEVIFASGHRIFLFDIKQNKIVFIHRGRSPLLVLKE